MVSEREDLASENLWDLMIHKEKAGADAEVLEGRNGGAE